MPFILVGVRRRRGVGVVPSILFCCLMAWARMFSGSHHLSDVMVAAIIGAAGGYCVWRWVIPRYIEPLLSREPAAIAIPAGGVDTLPALEAQRVSGLVMHSQSFRPQPLEP
jgi:hypothetical protein